MGRCLPGARLSLSPDAFILTRFELAPLPFRPDISLYHPTARSGLAAWLAAQGNDTAPYWAYPWAGGAALALYLRDHPEQVSGRAVLDFGSGSGLVAIAAAMAGAKVTAFEPDPIGRVAASINARANEFELAVSARTAEADIVLAGDVFYDAAVARQTLPALIELAQGGTTVLVGDPFRRDLPRRHLALLSQYHVPDMGSGAPVPAGIFRLEA